MAQTFTTVPVRLNGQDVIASWWNILRDAGINVENALGAGYLAESHVALTNGQASPANITGAVFDHTVYTSAKLEVEINQKTATNELLSVGNVFMFWRALSSAWDVVAEWSGDEPGITLSVTAGGQLQYTLGTLSGTGYVGNFKFKAGTFGV